MSKCTISMWKANKLQLYIIQRQKQQNSNSLNSAIMTFNPPPSYYSYAVIIAKTQVVEFHLKVDDPVTPTSLDNAQGQ